MTPEQLDEIEKLAEAATPGPLTARLTDRGHALWGPLPSGDCGSMRIALASYAAFDRANMLFVEGMREYALPLVKALREAWAALDQVSSDDRMSEAQITAAITEAQKDRDEAREDARKHREDALAWLYVSQDRAKERNEARAEVERLKSALRLLWHHANNAWIPRGCRNTVEAALKEGE